MAKRSAKKPETAVSFTAAQRQVIEHAQGPLLAGAVAGAGKSTTLVEHVAYLTERRGVPLGRVLLVAFNKMAATDLNRKLKKRLKGVTVTEEEDGEDAETGIARTLHSLALQIWRSSEQAKRLQLDHTGVGWTRAIRQAHKLLSIREPDVNVVKRFASKIKNDYLPANETMYRLGQVHESLLASAEDTVGRSNTATLSANELITIYFEAERLKRDGLVDGFDPFVTFDDLLFEAVRLLQADETWCERWQRRYDRVIVDETQDLCMTQWMLVDLLAAQHQNVVVVGDPAQAIYAFRGAKPEMLVQFSERYQNTRTVWMEHNFRSGQLVVETANAIIDALPDSAKLPMHLISTRGIHGYVGMVERRTPHAEAEMLADACAAHNARGVEWRDMAVLVRMNDQTKDIELAMFKKRVPLRMVSGTSFFSLPETKAMLAYFRVLAGKASREDFQQCITHPSRYLGKTFVDAVAAVDASDGDWLPRIEQSEEIKKNRSLADPASQFVTQMSEWRRSLGRGASPGQVLDRILEATRYGEWHMKQSRTDEEPTSDFSGNIDRCRDFMFTFNSADVMLQTVDDMRAAQRSAAASRNAVTLSTVHIAKGLEWPVVFIPDVTAKRWPCPWSPVDEELRLFYVACTRARDELWISTVLYEDDDETEECKPSPFADLVKGNKTDALIAPTLASGQMALI